ncbi:MAG: aminoglycoside phosphotransferase family protein [Candidatus Saccharibacteria bacterium]|nr:aminoglycoside phosphotransferase family protein [Candidatus Saccharibacteria bacterium]
MSVVQFNEFKSEAEQKRLLDLAEANTSPDELIASIVSSALGEEVVETTRIVRGETNEVYGIRTNQKRDIILRIGHWDKTTFQREAWAIEQAVAVGVPVPKILALGEHSTDVYYCVQEKLQGTPLDSLLFSHNLPKDRAKRIVENAGEMLGRLHSIETTGWGYLSEPTKGQHAKLDDKYSMIEAERKRIAAALQATNLPVADVDTILSQLKSGLQAFEGRQRLIHGDFGPKHIFVDDNDSITGIIDWEQAGSDDPVAEFARWNFWFDKNSPTAWLKEGHERVAKLGDDYDERFRIATLESAIWTLLYFTYDSPLKDCAVRAVRAIAEATA